jgi:hypothetical protein
MRGNLARFEPPPSSGRGNFNAAASWIDPKSLPRLWTPEQGTRRKRFRDNPIQAMRVKKGGKGRPATRRFLTRRKSRKQRPSIDGAAGPSSRRVVREGKAMIHSSRRDRKAKAIAEVLAMIANAQAPLVSRFRSSYAHFACVSSVRWQKRSMDARMASADFVQRNGLGAAFLILI